MKTNESNTKFDQKSLPQTTSFPSIIPDMCSSDVKRRGQASVWPSFVEPKLIVLGKEVDNITGIGQGKEAYKMSALQCDQWTSEERSGFDEDFARAIPWQEDNRPNNVRALKRAPRGNIKKS